ncbi:hypothetical protein E2C01_001428 [Portunus trituberculatus]|uniref:Uncharacterized protein n=1 Tax=Portunus trituberculatus TaxID=210409 RepID=A0A5B7CJE2_PORTR|nr:hypothetical protein [Portunus trituberculatus]
MRPMMIYIPLPAHDLNITSTATHSRTPSLTDEEHRQEQLYVGCRLPTPTAVNRGAAQNLTRSLVLKLVILTQEVLTVVTPEDASSVAPHLSAPQLSTPFPHYTLPRNSHRRKERQDKVKEE